MKGYKSICELVKQADLWAHFITYCETAFGGFGLVQAKLWLWLDWARFGPNLACFGLGSARVRLVFVASWSGWARLWFALKRLYKCSDAPKKVQNDLLLF
jgi:hypothetical protein